MTSRQRGDKKLIRKISERERVARDRELKKATFKDDEIYHKEDGVEVGLVIFSLKLLQLYHILEGRKNEVRRYMEDLGETQEEAVNRVRRNMRLKGLDLGIAWSHVEYLY